MWFLLGMARAATLELDPLLLDCQGQVDLDGERMSCPPRVARVLPADARIVVWDGSAVVSGLDGYPLTLVTGSTYVAPAQSTPTSPSLLRALAVGLFGGTREPLTKGGAMIRLPPVRDLDTTRIVDGTMTLTTGSFDPGDVWVRLGSHGRFIGAAHPLAPDAENRIALGDCADPCPIELLQFDLVVTAGSARLRERLRMLLDAEPAVLLGAWATSVERVEDIDVARAHALDAAAGLPPVAAAAVLAEGGWLLEARSRFDAVPGGLREALSGWRQLGGSP